MWRVARWGNLEVMSLRAVAGLGEEVLMDEKPESENRPDPGRPGEAAAAPDEAASVHRGAPDGDDGATWPVGSAASAPAAAPRAAGGNPPAGADRLPVGDELPAGSTVPAGYVAVPAGSSTAQRAARRAVWRARWKRFWAPALIGLILGGLLGSGITALALHGDDHGRHFRPGIVHRDGPGIGPRFGPGFPGGPGDRDGGPRFPGVPQNPQVPTPTPSPSG
jgi:hypothetical protein